MALYLTRVGVNRVALLHQIGQDSFGPIDELQGLDEGLDSLCKLEVALTILHRVPICVAIHGFPEEEESTRLKRR